MSETTTCPSCGESTGTDAAFCEACGAVLRAAPAPTAYQPSPDASPVTSVTVPVTAAAGAPAAAPTTPAAACTECGGLVDADLYCTVCGAKAPSPRDHFELSPASWVAGVCDRGIRHLRNEDAMALMADAEPGGRAVLVVCDGVSNSENSDVASLAASAAALEVLAPPLPSGLGVPESADAAAARVFATAAKAANTAVIANTNPSSPSPPSCTFVAAVLTGDLIRFANLGDSRAYLLRDSGGGTQLSQDHSMAAEFMAAGVPRAEAETRPQAHSITRWLGLDAPDLEPFVGSTTVTEPGWLLVCSDGLWNYASDPAALTDQIAAAGAHEPAALARALTDWANAQGGQDNITVTLARVGGPVTASTSRSAVTRPEATPAVSDPTTTAPVPEEEPTDG